MGEEDEGHPEPISASLESDVSGKDMFTFFDASQKAGSHPRAPSPFPSPSSPPSIRQVPHIIPAILPHTRLIVYSFLSPTRTPRKSILLSGITGQGPIQLEIPLEQATEGTKIHTLAVRRMITELEDGASYLHLDKSGIPTPRSDTRETVDSEIRDLALRFSLLSKQTSFVAVDCRD